MDPNSNLMEQLRISKDILKTWDACKDDGTLTGTQSDHIAIQANRLAELVEALNGWIVSGGFLPVRWVR